MIDRNEVVRGLRIERECVSRDCDRDCGKCDLVQDRDWLLSVYDDALALLKKQEPMDIKSYYGHGACPSCYTTIPRIIGQETRFCPFCGQAVKWNDKC